MTQQYDTPAQESDDDQIVENAADASIDAASDPDDSAAEGASPPQPSAREQRLQRRLTESGRRAAAAETSAAAAQRQNEVLAAQINQMDAKLADMGQYLTNTQQRDQDAYLQSLPAEQRALAKIDILERRLAGTGQPTADRATSPQAQQRPAAPSSQRPSPDEGERASIEYARRRSQEILDDLADETGVDLARDTEGLDYTSEAAFRASATAIATMVAKGGSVPKKKGSADEDTRETANRPMSPRAVPRKRGQALTPEDFNGVLNQYDSRKGPKATKRALEKLRS